MALLYMGSVEHAAVRQLHVSHDELVLISSREGTAEDMLQLTDALFWGWLFSS